MLIILLIWIALLDKAVKLNSNQKGEENRTVNDAAETSDPMIRVLLMDTGYRSYFHQKVSVVYGNSEITYTPSSPELADSPLILTEQENGITVTSIERQQGNPTYYGCLEVRSMEQGLLIINELPLETYLESVVPSEMPSSYETEALKAQAVCARTYAYCQMEKRILEEYDADVDDSVRFQVYGNIAPEENTTSAVRDTQGQVLCQNGELIQAYYFSTSAGITSTDEIWGAEEAASYLRSVPCEFDQEEPWSSWNVSIPWKILEQRCLDYPKNVSDINNVSDTNNDAETVAGSLKSLEITRKNQSGAVTGLHVVTETGSFDLKDEYSIREFLSPSGCTFVEKDGTAVQGGTLLPSAYFEMKSSPGEIVAISGKGYGHGVGMSQTAANEMADQGYDYGEILDYFFNNVEILSVNSTAG